MEYQHFTELAALLEMLCVGVVRLKARMLNQTCFDEHFFGVQYSRYQCFPGKELGKPGIRTLFARCGLE